MTDSSRSTRLATYAVAAVSPLFAGSAAMADAVIVDITAANANSSFTIDLGVAGLGGGYTFSNLGNPYGFAANVKATIQSNNQQGVETTFRSEGQTMGTSRFWFGGQASFLNPAADTTKYLGFRLTLAGGDYRYGWVEYVNSGGSVTVSRWAYESSVNTAIVAGASSAPTVPGLGGLAALACGAAGVRRNRNRVA